MPAVTVLGGSMKTNTKTYLFSASLVMSAAIFTTCSQGNFSGGDGNGNKSGAEQNPQNLPGTGVPGTPGDPLATPGPDGIIPTPPPLGGLGNNTGVIPLNELVKCTQGLVSMIRTSNPAASSCPANSTVYAADDGSEALFACCALPKGDIFLTSVQPVARGNECMEDELVVGLSGSNMVCQKIDVTKYKLANPAKACYFGNGASGSTGSGSCGAPNMMLNAIGSKFGSDGCIAPPGSIVHGRKGKTCGDVPIRALQSIDGAPVAFPY